MKKGKFYLLVIALFALMIVAGCGGKKGEEAKGGGKVVGVVGNEKVTWREFKRELDNLPPYYRRFLQRADAQATYLKKYLIRKAMVMEAEARGYDRDPQIRREVERFKEQLLIRKLREEERKKFSKVTDDEVKQYYEEHKDRYKVGEQRQIRTLMIKVPRNASKAQWRAAERKIKLAERELRRGVPWDKVFKKFNQDETVNFSKGELPYFSKDRRIRYYMTDDFIKAVFSLKKKGDIAIVKTPFGYNLIQLLGKKPPRIKEFIEVAPEIKRELEQRKRYMQEKKLEDMLVKKYNIKVYRNALEAAKIKRKIVVPQKSVVQPKQKPQQLQNKKVLPAKPAKKQQSQSPKSQNKK